MNLSSLPSVEEVLTQIRTATEHFPRSLVVNEVRRAIANARARLALEPIAAESIPAAVVAALENLQHPSLRPVINATGVILHTNLGRAPLGPVNFLPGYSNLEYDTETGKRGKRDVHIAPLLERLIGASGIAVNNNAAAVYLALHELAAGQEVIVSRGELIEIGDGFRIPDIMARSGAILREIGTTNRTSLDDYRNAITERTRLILRVHPSNFRIEGFTARPGVSDLAAMARERAIPLYEDLGSGCLLDLSPYGVNEPRVQDSLSAGANLVSFSTDKLMGGPQTGILAGDANLVARLRKNPMFRALRLDKLIYHSLETTLRNLLFEQYEKIPALRMLMASAEAMQQRSEKFCGQIPGGITEIVAGTSLLGGGSTPTQEIETTLIAVNTANVTKTEKRLRQGQPAVLARIEAGRLLIDLRTVAESEEPNLIKRLLETEDQVG